MNNLEYLNQISQSSRPTRASKASSVNGGLILKILIGGLLATALLIGFGLLINNNSSRVSDLTKRLYNRTIYVKDIITTYNKSLKSSQLRSINYSLSGTLTGTSAQLASYITAHTDKDTKKPLANTEAIAAVEETYFANINDQLSTAKLNGLLDRYYSNQIYLQVELLLSMASELNERDKDPALLQILKDFSENLDVIANSLKNYTDSSN